MKGQELKRRITGIKETVKITKAMQMISASKMHKAQQSFDSAKRYLSSVTASADLVRTKINANHPYLNDNRGDTAYFIVIAGDKGLCGDYNNLVLGHALSEIKLRNVSKILPVGHIAKDYFKKKGYDVINAYVHLGQDPVVEDAKLVTNDIISRFMLNEVDKVYIAYTDIKTLANQNIVIDKLLPLPLVESEEKAELLTGENSVENILSHYILAKIYYALVSSSLAINYKRMIAMQQSTTNGEEIIYELTLQYNHKRQESITTELVDASASLQGKRL